jgi:hypothetical protein
MRDVRMAVVGDMEAATRSSAPAPRCEVCDRSLPKGLERRRCLAHSPYAQMVMRHEQTRRGRRVRAAARRVA